MDQPRPRNQHLPVRTRLSGPVEGSRDIDTRECINGEIEADEDEEDDADSEAEDTKPDTRKVLDARTFVDLLRQRWPMFLYFNEFDDTLPRDVAFTDLEQELERRNSGSPKPASRVKQPVWDFVSLARIDVGYVAKIAGDDKKLSNYLANRAAHITGDFLSYWTQRADDESTVDLRVRHHRDTDGDLRLAFYVHDTADQYPEQRSKGFLWFLSFYLRLAATHIAGSEQQLFLLIDEPGSYLHAKAQKDVLRLFDERIAKRDLIAYATHSPYLLPPEKLHRVRVVSKDHAKGTRVYDRVTHPDLRGNAFGDALSPVLTRIGLDIRDRLLPIRKKNIIVEGISDYLYLAAWADRIDPDFLREFSIFPATGAPTVPSLISLMRGWGLSFVVLLARYKEGNRTRDRLMRELLVPDERIVQPQDAIAIEGVFDATEFASILAQAEWVGKTEHGQTPTAIIKRERLDKVLIAQAFASMPREQMLDGRSADRFRRLLGALRAAADGPSGLPQGIPAWTPGGERKTARVARGPTP